jgi:hypothetical protein
MPPRMLDLVCRSCGTEVTDLFVREVPVRIVHFEDDGEFEQVYRLPRRDAQWSDRDAVVVFRDAQGHIRYPGRNDAIPPRGYEKVVMRSMHEVRQFEKAHGVVSHIAHFDNGSGRAIDDELPTPRLPSEQERWERFRKSTQGIF